LSNAFFWDNLGQLAGKGGRTALLSDISRNCNALFWKESRRKPLTALEAISACKAVDAGSIPTPASSLLHFSRDDAACRSERSDIVHRSPPAGVGPAAKRTSLLKAAYEKKPGAIPAAERVVNSQQTRMPRSAENSRGQSRAAALFPSCAASRGALRRESLRQPMTAPLTLSTKPARLSAITTTSQTGRLRSRKPKSKLCKPL